MTITHFRFTRLAMAAAFTLLLSNAATAVTMYDQDVTPDILFGDGNVNGSFTTDRVGGLEIGLRGKLRFDDNNQPQNVFNSNGDGTYTFESGLPPTGFGFAPNSPTTPIWSFEWSVNTDTLSTDAASSLVQLEDYRYELRLDGDPGPGTDFLVFDPINVPNADHGIGGNDTANGAGDDDNPRTDMQYAMLIEANNVAQNSWSYEFFNDSGTALENFDPTLNGSYTIELEAFDRSTGASVGLSSIVINTVPEPGTLALCGLAGLFGSAVYLRKRRR